MNNTRLSTLNSTAILLNQDDIDTDQIIPARFLKTISKTGLGDHLFADWRYDDDGNPKPEFVLNQPGANNTEILVTGNNFGCGSSREHAPWALKAFGIRSIIATSFADIFKNNAVKNGLLPIQISKDAHTVLIETLVEIHELVISIDLLSEKITLPTGVELAFEIDSFSKKCLLEGINEMDYLLAALDDIKAYENTKQ